MNTPTAGDTAFPVIRQPHRQPRVLRAMWAGVTLALWIAYGWLALPLLQPAYWQADGMMDWLVRHRGELAAGWMLAVGAAAASILLVAWAELDQLRQRRRPPSRLPDAHAQAIARRLHASDALHAQLVSGKITRLHLDDAARPVHADTEPLAAGPGGAAAGYGKLRVCPSPRTTKRSTVSASRPMGP